MDGKTVGRAYLYVLSNDLHTQPFGLLEDVYVEPEYRGQGIATVLIERVIKVAHSLDCYKLIATSRYSREKVHEMYERLGFQDYGKEFRMDFS